MSTALIPQPVIAEDLVDDTRGSVSLPETALPGQTVTVELGDDLTAEGASALVFTGGASLPLGELTSTSAVLTVPTDAQPGEWQVAIVLSDGSLYGWDDLRVVAPTVEPTATPEPTSSPEPTPAPSATLQASGGLAVTGGADPGGMAWGALAVCAIGAGVLLVARSRAGARSQ